MKIAHAFLAIVFLIEACATAKTVFPKEVDKKVKFAMSLDAFKNLKGAAAKELQTNDFRTVYLEEVNGEKVSSFVYYFDNEDDKPLYEVIINYNTTEQRDADANRLFGKPNFEGKEWLFVRKPYDIRAWTFKEKLIITALIPKTEWYLDGQEKNE